MKDELMILIALVVIAGVAFLSICRGGRCKQAQDIVEGGLNESEELEQAAMYGASYGADRVQKV